MLASLRNALSRVVGGSVPERVEMCLFEIHNDAVKLMSLDTTVCLVPQIVQEGNRLTFQMSPVLKNASSSSHNLLGHLRNSIELDRGEKIIIMSITRIHVSNELDGVFKFDLANVFDDDVETQKMRQKIDAAVAMDNRPVDLSVRARPPPLPAGNDNNNNAIASDAELAALDALLIVESTADSAPFQGDSAEEVLRKADAMTIRGQRIHRNREETTNVISLGTIQACSTVCIPKTLYRASVSEDVVKWFAGQDKNITEDPLKVHTRVNLDTDTRATKPVLSYLIYPADHALVLFIQMFEDDLQGKEERVVLSSVTNPLFTGVSDKMRLMHGDRDNKALWYQVDKDLIDSARDMILVVVYAQMYYTTLRDCTLVRLFEEEQEFALVQKLAKQWGLKVDPVTKRVSDWAPGAYRPVIVVTLHVKYFVVTGVESSAASLHKKKTILSPV
jgi:hypothetical protein